VEQTSIQKEAPCIIPLLTHPAALAKRREKMTYQSVGKVTELLNQHLLHHVWLRNNNIHPTTEIVPRRNKKKD
jgi:hypothetical protein